MTHATDDPTPSGQLALQTLSMPADTNPQGDIFGGWIMSQMDLAGAIYAQQIAQGRVTTAAVGSMSFLRPVPVGATVSCYVSLLTIGRSSIRLLIEVWIRAGFSKTQQKVTEGEFIYVALDDKGHSRSVPQPLLIQ